jgi:hypothetical protein
MVKDILLLNINSHSKSCGIGLVVPLLGQPIKAKSFIDIRPMVMMWFNYPLSEDKINLPVNINVFKEKIIMKAVGSRKELERSFNHFLLKKNNDHPSSEHQIYV